MSIATSGLFKRFTRKEIELEVDEELRFHIEMLNREHIRRGISPEEVEHATLKRFGDIQRIKNQCVEISRRSRPLIRALKSFLILVFLTGISTQVLGTDLYIKHLGNTLIAVAVLSRLLLYARGLSSSSFLSKPETSSTLMLNDSQIPIAGYEKSRD